MSISQQTVAPPLHLHAGLDVIGSQLLAESRHGTVAVGHLAARHIEHVSTACGFKNPQGIMRMDRTGHTHTPKRSRGLGDDGLDVVLAILDQSFLERKSAEACISIPLDG